MDKGALLILSLLFLHSCSTPKSILQPPSASAILLQKDRLDNFYLAVEEGVYKLSNDGDTLGYYLNRRWGNPQGIDVFNPQKILLHYRSYNKVVILDRSLSSELVTDLESWSWDIQTLGQSSDQNLWVYDLTDRRIKKMSFGGEVILQSDPIYFLFDQDFTPDQIMERKGIVWVGDKAKGWLRLDLFGQYMDFLPQPHRWFTVTQSGHLMYWVEENIKEWAPGSGIPQIVGSGITSQEQLLSHWEKKIDLR